MIRPARTDNDLSSSARNQHGTNRWAASASHSERRLRSPVRISSTSPKQPFAHTLRTCSKNLDLRDRVHAVIYTSPHASHALAAEGTSALQ